ncbi:hypothetical protein L3V77_11925 [Vibrio sp. DW001]|uniref:hypothetical protein n=1 Tax=Vibrio sp. DW001 TaxID=2912315 RepID=UPI0023AF4F2B|nr:hypothetical protein [Vibrio sp. DW001]WED25759.1 hypothetical protein L3V77_11925 [Vibrio sp. DW001]
MGNEVKIDSLQSELSLLENILSNPDEFRSNDTLICSLKTQSSFSMWKDDSLGIQSYSLNTQKRLANELIGGYTRLNNSRLKALMLLTQGTDNVKIKANRAETISRLKEVKNDLTSELEIVRNHNLLLTAIVSTQLEALHRYSNSLVDKEISYDAEHMIKKVMAQLDFTNRNTLPTNSIG